MGVWLAFSCSVSALCRPPHADELWQCPLLSHHSEREGGKEGGTEGGKEGGTERGKEGGMEGGTEGGKEGGKEGGMEGKVSHNAG